MFATNHCTPSNSPTTPTPLKVPPHPFFQCLLFLLIFSQMNFTNIYLNICDKMSEHVKIYRFLANFLHANCRMTIFPGVFDVSSASRYFNCHNFFALFLRFLNIDQFAKKLSVKQRSRVDLHTPKMLVIQFPFMGKCLS